MSRLPNTYSPEEVRRAVGRLRLDSDSIESRVGVNETNITSIDGRVTDLEDVLPSYEGEADEAISAGEPVYSVGGLTSVGVARADTAAKARVAGIAVDDAGAGFACKYLADGRLELVDWTSATGGASLTTGAAYYLAPTGGITTVAPTSAGEFVVFVGKARSGTVLDIEIQPPILL